ncbi:MAG: GAF domain-containing protein [Nitrospinae bacterium]|nr:GAF domain-containing protein [Nitrospinota bacterium]
MPDSASVTGALGEVDLQTVNTIGRLITSKLTLKEMVREIVQNLGRVIETDEVNVVQYDGQRRELKFLASYFADGSNLKRPEVYPLSDGMNSWIIKNRTHLLIKSDTVAECAALGIRHGGSPAKSWLGVPLQFQEEVVGALSIQSYGKAGLYDERAIALLSTVAAQCAVAMENARLYEEVLEREIEKERLYFSLTHDLLSLVSPVSGFARLLKGLPPETPPEKVMELATSLVNSTARITRFVEDILVYAKIKSGKLALNIERADVFRALVPVISHLEPEMKMRRLTFSINGMKAGLGQAPTLGALEADFDVAQMERVFLNLVGNAVKYGQSEISVEVKQEGQEIICSVRNDGHGVAHGQVGLLFDEYYQAGVKNRGVGLGLPTVKRIVELHYGHITATSAEGKGFGIEFRWPRTLADRRELENVKAGNM